MVKANAILFLFLFTGSLTSRSQDISQVRLLRETAARFGQAEVIVPSSSRTFAERLSKEFSVSGLRDGMLHVVVNERDTEQFVQFGANFKVVLPSLPKGIQTASSVKGAMEWDVYPTYTQYDSIMRKFASDYPQLCTLDTIGFSIYGKLVLVLKISDNAAVDEEEPEVFYTSTMHGDETGGFVLMLRLADYLLKNYNSDPFVKNLADNLEIFINPLSNPDGTYRTGNTISSPVRANASGRDLNRNFPDPLDPADPVEKENVDMIKFMRDRNFVISANFHAGEEVVNYPWDRWSRLHADDSWFHHISRAYADTIHSYAPSLYFSGFENGVTNGAAWYMIEGGRQDFVTWELQGREVTIELDYTKRTPAAELPLLWQYNYRSLLHYIENALFGIHGTVKDNKTGNPVPSRIFISNHDKDSSHIYSDTLSGKFVRMLYPGSWDLTFTAKGYYDTTVTVTVTERQRTDISVMMEPIITTVDTVDPSVPVIWPNPVLEESWCELPSDISGSVDIEFITVAGSVAHKTEAVVTPGVPFRLITGSLSGGLYSVRFVSKQSGRKTSAKIIVTGNR